MVNKYFSTINKQLPSKKWLNSSSTILLLVISAVLISCENISNENNKSANNQLSTRFDTLNIRLVEYASHQDLPGFVVAIFDKDNMLFSKGYGYTNLESKTPYTIKTVQGIASISKTFIGVALMKAVEQGFLDLDDDLNDYLPYDIFNPHFPDSKISIRHLATHTSGINDEPNGGKGNIFSKKLKKENWRDVWHPFIAKYNNNVDEPMDTFLAKIFDSKGEWYTKDVFFQHRPGTYYEYSNYGSALLAQIIEIATKTDYKQFTENEIFKPLKMTTTGWSREDFNTSDHITYYNDNYKPVPNYSNITYPDGGIYSNVADLTKYLQEMMRGYYGESSFLKESSFKEMMGSQSKLLGTNTGLFWDLDQSCCIGHGGNDFGIAAMMYFDLRDSLGHIVLSNIDVQEQHQDEAFYGVFNETFRSLN